jgi:hypothetical protein
MRIDYELRITQDSNQIRKSLEDVEHNYGEPEMQATILSYRKHSHN